MALRSKWHITPSFFRGLAFYKIWEVIHGTNPTARLTRSTSVGWADFWQLEDISSSPILKSNKGFSDKVRDEKDVNRNGVSDGYERTGHLHIQDDLGRGAHK